MFSYKKRGIAPNAKMANLKKHFPNELAEEVRNNNTFIYGDVGTGKTWLLSAIVHESKETDPAFDSNGMCIQGTNLPLLINFSKLLFKLRGSYVGFKNSEYNILQSIISSPVIGLDDIGTSKPTEWNVEILYAIIDGRYQNQKRTHIASNFNRKEIADIYGNRIASRITEMCKDIHLTGNDKRLSKNKQ